MSSGEDQEKTQELLGTIKTAVEGLSRLGWVTTTPPPRGCDSLVVEAGSTGVFRGRYLGAYFFVEDGGDLWPARPIAWKRVTDGTDHSS